MAKNIVYFDLETQKSAEEVGGWGNISKMGMSVGVTFSTASAGVSNTAYHPCIGRFPKKLKLCLQDRGGISPVCPPLTKSHMGTSLKSSGTLQKRGLRKKRVRATLPAWR